MSAISRLAGLFPPPFRRTMAGAWLDVRGLPRRLREPARWNEPWQVLHNVGGGDFAQAGLELLDQLRTFGGLDPESHVLDIGCGIGRLAQPLSTFLSDQAGYTGFDVSPRAVAICRKRFAQRRPDFRFVEADLGNAEYRAKGREREDAYRFPVDSNSVEVAAAFSVFSHMRLASIRHYLQEASRVLAPGGRFVFTAYALTPERVEGLARGAGSHRFQPWRDGSMVVDARSPERAIAHPVEEIERALQDAGLVLPAGVRLGGWLGTAAYGGAQDLFVAIKPAV